jgi:hypothetical protein
VPFISSVRGSYGPQGRFGRGKTIQKYFFSYTGSDQIFTVPSGATEMIVKCWGAGGTYGQEGSFMPGGSGGFSSSTISVSSGEQLVVVVGQGGLKGSSSSSGTLTGRTYGGGGHGNGQGGSGGGLSGIFSGTSQVFSGGTPAGGAHARSIIIAGGGGGGGINGASETPPAGGGLSGRSGGSHGSGLHGQGGTQTSGGACGIGTIGSVGTDGSALSGGNVTADHAGASGGGGGYYGGGGSRHVAGVSTGIGGGGSGFVGFQNGSTSTILTSNVSPRGYEDIVTRVNGSRTYKNSKCLSVDLSAGTVPQNPPQSDDLDYISFSNSVGGYLAGRGVQYNSTVGHGLVVITVEA